MPDGSTRRLLAPAPTQSDRLDFRSGRRFRLSYRLRHVHRRGNHAKVLRIKPRALLLTTVPIEANRIQDPKNVLDHNLKHGKEEFR